MFLSMDQGRGQLRAQYQDLPRHIQPQQDHHDGGDGAVQLRIPGHIFHIIGKGHAQQQLCRQRAAYAGQYLPQGAALPQRQLVQDAQRDGHDKTQNDKAQVAPNADERLRQREKAG